MCDRMLLSTCQCIAKHIQPCTHQASSGDSHKNPQLSMIVTKRNTSPMLQEYLSLQGNRLNGSLPLSWGAGLMPVSNHVYHPCLLYMEMSSILLLTCAHSTSSLYQAIRALLHTLALSSTTGEQIDIHPDPILIYCSVWHVF